MDTATATGGGPQPAHALPHTASIARRAPPRYLIGPGPVTPTRDTRTQATYKLYERRSTDGTNPMHVSPLDHLHYKEDYKLQGGSAPHGIYTIKTEDDGHSYLYGACMHFNGYALADTIAKGRYHFRSDVSGGSGQYSLPDLTCNPAELANRMAAFESDMMSDDVEHQPRVPLMRYMPNDEYDDLFEAMKKNPDSAVPLWRESLRELHSPSYNLTSDRVEDYSGYRKGRRGPGYEAVLVPILDVSRTGPQARRGVSALYPTWRTHSVRPASAYNRSIGATNNDKLMVSSRTANWRAQRGSKIPCIRQSTWICNIASRWSASREELNALQYFQQVLEKAVDAHNAEAEQGSTELAPISEIKILADQENTSYNKLLRDLAGMDDPAEAASAPALWAMRDKAYTAFARLTSQDRSLDLDRFRDPSSHIPAFSGHRGIKMYRLGSEKAGHCEDDGDVEEQQAAVLAHVVSEQMDVDAAA